METDGESYHIGKEEGQRDRTRNNALATVGWHVLRFDTQEIWERMAEYCVPRILEMVGRLQGLQEEGDAPRLFHPAAGGEIHEQLSLFARDENSEGDGP